MIILKNRALENQSEVAAIRWYASIALIEIGDRSDDVLQILADTYMDCLTNFNCDETIRAFSHFKKPEIIEYLIKIAKEEIEIGLFCEKFAIYALAASGEPSAKEYLEFLATSRNENRDLAKDVLKHFGESFDKIKYHCHRQW